MNNIEADEIVPGLTARLDPRLIPRFGRYAVKARVINGEGMETDEIHSFLLIAFERNTKLWLCTPLFSERAIGNMPLNPDLKTGSFDGWKSPSFISPYQQWMLSEKAIIGASSCELTQRGGRSFYAVNDSDERSRLVAMAKINDAQWRGLGTTTDGSKKDER